MRDRHIPASFTFPARPVPGVYFPPKPSRFNWATALRVAGLACALGVTLALLSGCETMQQQSQQQIDPAVLGAILHRPMSQPVQLHAPYYSLPMQQNFRPQRTCTVIGANVFCN